MSVAAPSPNPHHMDRITCATSLADFGDCEAGRRTGGAVDITSETVFYIHTTDIYALFGDRLMAKLPP